MKHGPGLSALRALSQAGLPSEAFVTAALEALHGVVPSYRNLFDWTDDAGNLVHYYFEGPIDHDVASHYFQEFYNGREAEVMPHFRQAIHGRAGVRSAEELDSHLFFRSALYNEVWRPQGLHTRVEALVRNARGRTLGSLVLYRAPGEPKFTRAEEKLLEQVIAYLAHGLEEGERAQGVFDYSRGAARKALVSIDGLGRIVQLSSEALKLLLLAHGGVTPASVSRCPRREDFATVNALWQHHERSLAQARQPKALTIENAWGRFTFESEPMRPVQAGDLPMLHVVVTHFEPHFVSVRRALSRLPLSPAQREVCALMHRGESQAQIARALNVSITTVADHVRKSYMKLDIHSVTELSSRIGELAGR
jgi:DNA-binding CsgD family transcriptional regulator/GAF domain-containing protein